MSWVLIVILVLIVLLVIYAIALYNGLVQKRNRVDNSWAQIEVQLKRRHDLIPNLVETVKGYAAHERGVFEAVTQARAAAVGAQGVAQTAAAEGILTPGARPALRRRRGVPGPEGEHELPRPPEPAPRHRGQDRGLAPGLQRHGPHVQQRDPGLPRSPRRRHARLHEARVLRDRGRRRARGAGRQLPAGAPGRAGRSICGRCADAAEQLAPFSLRHSPPSSSPPPRRRSRSRFPRRTSRCRSTKDGSLVVDELITYAFSGALQRRLPRHPAPQGRVDRPRAGERGGPRLPSGRLHRARLRRRTRHVRTTTVVGDHKRIVWHYQAQDETRTFRIRYRLSRRRRRLRRRRRREPAGLGLGVGGAARSADRDRDGAGEDPQAWGHPVYVRGDVQLAGRQAVLRAP